MWLSRHLHGITSFAARTYYRITVAGESIPAAGPVLLVANHPNSLMDPALVAAVSQRPVRFLARAPLLEAPLTGWMLRAWGAIPIYRRSDDPEKIARNTEMFSAVWSALAGNSVVGIFPEGVSHSEPSLVPLKTGAARIALGAARNLGRYFPILPVGITFRGDKERFRSESLVLVGKPVRWDDLVRPRDPSPEEVRELTRRIRTGLSRITVNLEGWDDLPVVLGAEAIHDAEFSRNRGSTASASEPMRWLVRVRRTASWLERVRHGGGSDWEPLATEIAQHMRVLGALGVEARDLHEIPKWSVAVRWTIRNLFFFGMATPLAMVGSIVFLPPYLLMTRAQPWFHLTPDRRATYKVLGGAACFGGWILLIAATLREFMGWQPALWTLGLLPLLGLLTLRIRDRWDVAVGDLKRILLHGRRDLRAQLLERQRTIAQRIQTFRRSPTPSDDID